MFPRILGAVVVTLVIALVALEVFILRGKRGKNNLFVELLPVLGFIGAILVALAFVEAARYALMAAWQWGIALGFVLAIGVLIARWARGEPTAVGRRAWIRLIQTYGLVGLVGILGVVIAVRVIGALLEVFIASALGMAVFGAALGIVIAGRMTMNSKQ